MQMAQLSLKMGPHTDLKSDVEFDRDLFLLAAQLLCEHIINSNLQGISIAGRTGITSRLADDTTLFLQDSSHAPLAIDTIEVFSKGSGLCLNLKQCELLALKDCDVELIANIPVKSSINYLGIVIDKNEPQKIQE